MSQVDRQPAGRHTDEIQLGCVLGGNFGTPLRRHGSPGVADHPDRRARRKLQEGLSRTNAVQRCVARLPPDRPLELLTLVIRHDDGVAGCEVAGDDRLFRAGNGTRGPAAECVRGIALRAEGVVGHVVRDDPRRPGDQGPQHSGDRDDAVALLIGSAVQNLATRDRRRLGRRSERHRPRPQHRPWGDVQAAVPIVERIVGRNR